MPDDLTTDEQGGSRLEYLHCNNCGKQVSSGFYPMPVEGFKGLVVRAWIECPECIEKRPERVFTLMTGGKKGG